LSTAAKFAGRNAGNRREIRRDGMIHTIKLIHAERQNNFKYCLFSNAE